MGLPKEMPMLPSSRTVSVLTHAFTCLLRLPVNNDSVSSDTGLICFLKKKLLKMVSWRNDSGMETGPYSNFFVML